MTDSPREETREKMLALCRQIAVSHDLDTEIQKELYGHMEDKLTAYVSGQEAVTEDDAFILVREHFGDPVVIKALFRDAHPREVHATLGRRIAAAWVVCAAVTILTNWVVAPLFHLLTVTTEPSFFLVYALPLSISYPLLVWAAFARLQRAIRAGQLPWVLRWRPAALAVLLLAVCLFKHFDLALYSSRMPEFFAGQGMWWYTPLMYVGSLAGNVLCGLAWVWWCHPAPRTWRNTTYAAMAWALYLMLGFTIPHVTLGFGAHEPLAGSVDMVTFMDGLPMRIADGVTLKIAYHSIWWRQLLASGGVQALTSLGTRLIPVGIVLATYLLAPGLRVTLSNLRRRHDEPVI